jgi:uncharacterized membrane protein
MQHTVYVSDLIDAPIDKVWRIMRDFNDMPSYHPGVKGSLIENGLPSDQVGCVRRLTLGQGFVRERLLCMDDLNRVFTYEIIDGTLPVRGYVPGSGCIASPKANGPLRNGGRISKSLEPTAIP